MFNDINNILQFSISFGQILENLFVAFLCGLIVSYFYRKTYLGPGYLNSFVNAQVILSMITAIVIMIIGNNLARAFGLVGAMSIIRFRTAVKETNDIIFIFFALALVLGLFDLFEKYGSSFAGTLGDVKGKFKPGGP